MIFNMAGSSSPLNFRVVGGTAQPASADQNTLWLKTDAEITSYIFSGTAPESPEPGMAWFETAASGVAGFNALRKNAIHLYPISTKQYLDGAWKPMDAFLYDGTAWVQVAKGRLYLYKNGDRNLDVTGDFYHGSTIVSDGTAADGAKFLNFPSPGTEGNHYYTMKNKVDLSPFNQLVEKSLHGRPEGPADEIQILGADGSVVAYVAAKGSSAMQTLTLDVSGLNGAYSIQFHDYGNGFDNWDLYELYLE